MPSEAGSAIISKQLQHLWTLRALAQVSMAGLMAYLTGAWMLLTPVVSLAASTPDFADERRALVRELREELEKGGVATGEAVLDERVWAALERVPRHRFVPAPAQAHAYENRPLPIGHGQTISQPYIVAFMTGLAQVAADDVVLEIGTGSGYQAAVLGELAREVYSIEIIPPLGKRAAEVLATLGYDNVHAKVADGYYGWPEHAPFDAILVTAAAGQIPPPLIQQLKPGGRMIIPLGGAFFTQQLTVVEKAPEGQITTRQILPVRFVPLTGSVRR